MAAWLKISSGGIFEKFSARGGIPKIPPYPPVPVACFYAITSCVITALLALQHSLALCLLCLLQCCLQ